MAACSNMTKKLGIGCTVSLNALMVDGNRHVRRLAAFTSTASRNSPAATAPISTATNVDFDELMNRQKWYNKEEKIAFAVLQRRRGTLAPPASIKPNWKKLDPLLEPQRSRRNRTRRRPQSQRTEWQSLAKKMPEQEADVRKHNFKEVAFGTHRRSWPAPNPNRCIECKKPKCVDGCPVGRRHPPLHALGSRRQIPRSRQSPQRNQTCFPPSAAASCPSGKPNAK